MHRRYVLALSSALLSGALAGCLGYAGPGSDPDDVRAEPGTEPDVDDEQLAELVRETNGFAFDLFDELVATEPDANAFASPVNVSVALAMTYAGARGETRAEMAEALRYTLGDAGDSGAAEPDEELHEAYNELQRRLNERGEDVDQEDAGGAYDEDDDPVPFQLNLVNAIWSQEGYPFRQAYLEILDDHYGGGLREVDYRTDHEAAREEINDWVAERTEDRIDELLPEGALDELTRLVLANAIYFLANWEEPFDEANTSTETFTALDGGEHDVQMMEHREGSFPYAAVDGAQAVELPYVGGEASMLAILPPEGEFERYEASFDGATFSAIVDELDSREGAVKLPRFEFESGFELEDPLRALGMETAFEEREADFSGMADLEEAGENLFVDAVYHDSYVAVDEEGTEAAAATAVVIGADSAPADPFEFVADRPFLFAIRDRPTDAVLFLGRAVDPAGWK